MRKFRWGLVIVFVLNATACKNQIPLHTAFEGLTSEVAVVDGKGLQFSSAISINGLGKQQSGGMFYYYPGKKAADTYSLGISPKFSMLIETRYPVKPFSNVTSAATVGRKPDDKTLDAFAMNQITAIRDSYLAAREEAVKMIALKFKLDAANLALKDEKDGCAMAAQLLSVNEKNGVCDNKVISDEITSVEGNYLLSKGKAEQLKNKIVTMMNTGNIIVTRWSTEKNAASAIDVSKFFGIKNSSNRLQSGLLIFGDLRVTSLIPGEDYLKSLIDLDKPLNLFVSDLGIVTYSLQAKHLAYVQDMDYSSALNAHLDVSAKQIASYAGDIQKLYEELELKLALQMNELASIGNYGLVTNPVTTAYKYSFCDAVSHERHIKEEVERGKNYAVIYSVRTMPDKIADFLVNINEQEKREMSGRLKCND